MTGDGSLNLELIPHKKYIFYKDTNLQRRHNCFKKEVLLYIGGENGIVVAGTAHWGAALSGPSRACCACGRTVPTRDP
jgi:hypothetical protein